MDHASDLRGFPVIARDVGEQLGTLSTIHVDPESKRLAAIVVRTRWIGGEQWYVPIGEVETLGKDVVLIARRESAQKLTKEALPPGRSLKDLQGMRVTTLEGRYLGTLVDVDFSPEWVIAQLLLTEDKQLAVRADEIKIGDEILVPPGYAAEVRESREPGIGFLRRVLGSEEVEDTKAALKRALRLERSKPAEKSTSQDQP